MDQEEIQRCNIECRQILRDGLYTTERAAQLITWLHGPQHAIADLAARCLMKLGEPAYQDLYEFVSAPGYQIRPMDVWVLATLGPYEVIQPALHRWLASGDEELQAQCIISLAGIVCDRKKQSKEFLAADKELCLAIMQSTAKTSASMRVYLRDFKKCMDIE